MKLNGTNTFGQILQESREIKGFSFGQAAEGLSVPITRLWRWENNETKVDVQQFVDIALTYAFRFPAYSRAK